MRLGNYTILKAPGLGSSCSRANSYLWSGKKVFLVVWPPISCQNLSKSLHLLVVVNVILQRQKPHNQVVSHADNLFHDPLRHLLKLALWTLKTHKFLQLLLLLLLLIVILKFRVGSTQPDVTIVPSSPLVQDAEFFKTKTMTTRENISILPPLQQTRNFHDPSMPTHTPTSPVLMNGRANPAMASSASLAPKSANSLQVCKKLSTQSMKSVKSIKKVPSGLNLNCRFACGCRFGFRNKDSNRGQSNQHQNSFYFSSSSSHSRLRSWKNQRGKCGLQRQNTDTASISSKRAWSRSTARKPTGPIQLSYHFTKPNCHPPNIKSPHQSISSSTSKKTTGTAPYMSISPAQLSTSQRHLRTKSGGLLPKRLKPKKSANGMALKGSRPRVR